MKTHSTQSKGFTLLEILISLALLGILALVISSILIQSSRTGVQARGKATIHSELTLFSNLLENLLTNTTRYLSCNCHLRMGGNAAKRCVYKLATPLSNSTVLLDWETESSTDPEAVSQPGGDCLIYSDSNPTAIGVGVTGTHVNEGYYHRGCKKRFRLELIGPTRNTTLGGVVQIGSPGELVISTLDKDSAVTGVMARLNGVTSIRCGMSASISGSPSSSEFLFDIQAKTRINQSPQTTGGVDPESWHPLDTPAFNEGIHRQLSSAVPFRNLSSRGIHFGLTEAFYSCLPDGSMGTSNCCSGYNNATSCIAASSCYPAGTVLGMLSSDICCSKMKNAAFPIVCL